MSVAELIPPAMKASIWLIVFALGLKADLSDLTFLLRKPWLLFRSVLAMSLIMPALAVLLVKAMPLDHAIGAALVALSLSPVPPILPRKQIKMGADASYGIGLLAMMSVIAVIWIPITVELVDPLFPASLDVDPASVAALVLFTVLAPLVAGLAARRLSAPLADRAAPTLSALGSGLLLIGSATIVIAQWPAILSQVGDGALAAIAAFVLIGLAAGHVLGGPDPDDRTVLATATAARHPGVAVAIAQANFPEERGIAPSVLLYLIAAAVLSVPYTAWRTGAARKARDSGS